MIVGQAGGSNGSGNYQTQGYLYSGGQYTAINGAPYPANSTIASGINNSGAIVGESFPTNYTNYAGFTSFLYMGGLYTPINMPGELVTFAVGINDAGVIVGGASNDAVNASTGPGFIDDHGVFTSINVPGAQYTVVEGINNLDQIAGDYLDQNGNIQAFVGTPSPEPSTWMLMLVGSVALLCRRCRVTHLP